ncbi:hypothetical protein LCGC14_1928790, partial [marine sediment metagenome]
MLARQIVSGLYNVNDVSDGVQERFPHPHVHLQDTIQKRLGEFGTDSQGLV